MTTPTSSRTLAAQGLAVRLGKRDVLAGADLRIGPGWTAIVGPNGAGKSTLLRALAGLLRPTAGRAQLGELDLHTMRPAERAQHLAWLAQAGGNVDGDVTGDASVRETVALGRIARRGLLGTLDATDDAVVDDAMRQTECDAWADRLLRELSGGERQRVLLARVLATQAPILLLDEPTTHLDAPHQVALARLIRRIAGTRQAAGASATPRTVVTVLHDLPIALRADRVVALRDGRIAADGPPSSPALQRELERVFDGAVRIGGGHTSDAVVQVTLALDDAARG